MYEIKQTPEDFKVTEIPKVFTEGSYLIFKLTKVDYNTVSAVTSIAKFLNIPSRQIGFAGNKDRVAITIQYISIKDVSKERILSFKNPKINLEYIGTSNKPISLGDLEGNNFEVRLRNCKTPPKKITQFINYFGEQRFSENNKDVGIAILKKKFKLALDKLIESGCVVDSDKYSKNDFVGCIQQLPRKNISLIISSYQSYIWNKIVSNLFLPLKTIEVSDQVLNSQIINIKKNELPLVGFETEIENSPYAELILKIMKEESITQRDFIIPQLGHLSSAGNFREIICTVTDLEIVQEDNSTFLLKFTLPKGSYATVLIRQLF